MIQQLPPSRPVTNSDRDEILIPVASGIQELLFAPVNPFNNRPGFLAGPTADTGLGRAVQDLTRLNCRLWAARDKCGLSPRVNQYNGEVCGPYLDQLGENPEGGSIAPPFQGGQCSVLYRVRYSWQTVFTSGEISETRTDELTPAIPGPISGFAFQNQPGNSFIAITFGAPAVTENFRFSSANQGAFANARLENITRADGQADNCGNPATIVQPPGTVVPVTPIVPTINIDLPGIGPINVNVDLDPTGNIVIVAPDIGAEVTIAPDLDIDLGGGGGGTGDPTDPGIPGNPEGTGSGGGADGEAPPGSELVGLLVTVTQAPGDANKFSNNPKQPFRGIGYIRMGFPGRLGLDISGGTVISPQFFHAQQRGLTNWAVDANIGFNLTVQPYYRDIES